MPLSPARPASSPSLAPLELKHQITRELPRLLSRARKLLKSPGDAEDLVHDTVERALCFADSFTPGTNLRAWLFQIQHSVLVTRYRRKKREQAMLALFSKDSCVWLHPEAPHAPLPLSPATRRALDELPAHFRDVVLLVHLGELSYKEAAEELEVPVGTVMSRLFRARRLLASRLSTSDTPLPRAA
jgi:RNA polymerase sigma-70 factor (ECF subfamily)